MNAQDRAALEALRERFLPRSEGDNAPSDLEDYWSDERTLSLYDRYFAARIGWKWDAVLDEIALHWPAFAQRTLVDFGCGTGIATRRVLAHHGARTVVLLDRSIKAVDFAQATIAREHPKVAIDETLADGSPHVLLISHVLSELSELSALRSQIDRADAVLWVEPGARPISRRLSRERDRLVSDGWHLAGPCPHRAPCGALANDQDWCHFFARPPADVFQDPEWVEAGRSLGIDLRALPYSFLAATRTALPARTSGRVLGRPRAASGVAAFHLCDESGVHALELLKRTDKGLHKRMKGHDAPTFLNVEHDGRRVGKVAPTDS